MLASWLTAPVLKYFEVWQIFPVVALVVILIFWKVYRNKQM